MLRKNIRLRKEYLLKKQNNIKNLDKKFQVKKAIEENRAVPFALRGEEKELRHQLENDDDNTLIAKSHVDDEYEEAKYKDPKIMITTSRNPSNRLMNFQKVSLNLRIEIYILGIEAPCTKFSKSKQRNLCDKRFGKNLTRE